MYAHPSFCRGKPESLSELKKSTTASRRRLSKASSDDSSDDSISIPTESRPTARSVSPSPPPRNQTSARFQPTMQIGAPPYLGRNWLTFNERSLEQGNSIQSTPYIPIRKREVVGRLDLLALAIEHEACLAV